MLHFSEASKASLESSCMPSNGPTYAAKAIIEFVGTFFLVGVIGLAIAQPNEGGNFDAFAIAGALTALIYMGGPISGAHYNPVVTLVFAATRRMASGLAVIYILAQLAGSLVAAGLVSFILPGEAFVAVDVIPGIEYSVKLAIMEFFFTFLLVFTILNVAARRSTQGNSYYGLAIGLVVLAGALAVGPISGAVFNPAVAVGLSAMEASPWALLLWYFGAQIAGALVAAGVFEQTSPDA